MPSITCWPTIVANAVRHAFRHVPRHHPVGHHVRRVASHVVSKPAMVVWTCVAVGGGFGAPGGLPGGNQEMIPEGGPSYEIPYGIGYSEGLAGFGGEIFPYTVLTEIPNIGFIPLIPDIPNIPMIPVTPNVPTDVSEPGSLALLLAALVGGFGFSRRFRQLRG
jgi:PEP-CTERM motif